MDGIDCIDWNRVGFNLEFNGNSDTNTLLTFAGIPSAEDCQNAAGIAKQTPPKLVLHIRSERVVKKTDRLGLTFWEFVGYGSSTVRFEQQRFSMSSRKGILERLAAGPVVGDGSMVMTLEKRGYVSTGRWTPEAVLKYPEAVLQLHKEFVRAGADVVQTASFYSTDDRLSISGEASKYTCKEINEAACKLARKAADENGCLLCGGVSPTPSFELGKNEHIISREYAKQLRVYEEHGVDFIMCELFDNIREVEICAKEMKKLNVPVALSMALGVMGDVEGISVEECTTRMAKTGADIIGINCMFDYNTCLKIMSRMKTALSGLDSKPYLLCQPNGFLCPEVESNRLGYLTLPEYPLALDPRALTRSEAHDYARRAFDLGINYIGGCCGFEPYHIRSIAQELQEERGIVPPVNDMAQPYGGSFFQQSIVSSLEGGGRCCVRDTIGIDLKVRFES